MNDINQEQRNLINSYAADVKTEAGNILRELSAITSGPKISNAFRKLSAAISMLDCMSGDEQTLGRAKESFSTDVKNALLTAIRAGYTSNAVESGAFKSAIQMDKFGQFANDVITASLASGMHMNTLLETKAFIRNLRGLPNEDINNIAKTILDAHKNQTGERQTMALSILLGNHSMRSILNEVAKPIPDPDEPKKITAPQNPELFSLLNDTNPATQPKGIKAKAGSGKENRR